MNSTSFSINRRKLLASAAVSTLGLQSVPLVGASRQDRPESLVIDLDGELESIHPSLAYNGRDWSVVHALYDSIVMIEEDGTVVPLAADLFETDDAITFQVHMREGLVFHDGTAVTAESVRDSWAFLMDSGSSAADVFAVITDVEVEGDFDARIVCSEPAPWLPAQIATWMMLVPPGYSNDQAQTAPIGTGPFRFESGDPVQEIQLSRFDAYGLDEVKGGALADSVTFRVVPDAATRVADVSTGTAQIAANIPTDFQGEAESRGATVLNDPLPGSQWVRIATDTPPFDDPRVRQALNHAVDAVTIGEALLQESRALGSIFPDNRVPGYLDDVEPYAFDPDRARELLSEAGVDDGQAVAIEITQSARRDIAEAIAANLSDVGFDVEVIASDIATFNAGWADPERPALRLATWAPLYEPHTLLSLVFAAEGYLSRYANADVDAFIAEAAIEPDQDERRSLYEDLNRLMHEDAPVIFLWNLTASYAVTGDGELWTPDGTERIVPLSDPD